MNTQIITLEEKQINRATEILVNAFPSEEGPVKFWTMKRDSANS